MPWRPSVSTTRLIALVLPAPSSPSITMNLLSTVFLYAFTISLYGLIMAGQIGTEHMSSFPVRDKIQIRRLGRVRGGIQRGLARHGDRRGGQSGYDIGIIRRRRAQVLLAD